MRIISSQSFFLYAARPTVISTVDSGAEKSPVSMAPVPPLPLSFRPERSKAEWSGEISGPNGTGPIVVGDLSTQRNNRFQTPLPSYRHAAPLEMTYGRAALQSWGKETNDIDTIRPTVISTKALQSGELSGLNGTSASPPLSFRPQRSKAEWSGEISNPNGTSASPSHCHFDRNGAKRSGVEKSPTPMVPVPPLPLSFRPQRSVVEKSPDSVGQAPMRWEISRLRVSMIYKYFIPISTRSPARDDMWAGSEPSLWEFQSIEAKKKEL